jgi:hypothetical protein
VARADALARAAQKARSAGPGLKELERLKVPLCSLPLDTRMRVVHHPPTVCIIAAFREVLRGEDLLFVNVRLTSLVPYSGPLYYIGAVRRHNGHLPADALANMMRAAPPTEPLWVLIRLGIRCSSHSRKTKRDHVQSHCESSLWLTYVQAENGALQGLVVDMAANKAEAKKRLADLKERYQHLLQVQ